MNRKQRRAAMSSKNNHAVGGVQIPAHLAQNAKLINPNAPTQPVPASSPASGSVPSKPGNIQAGRSPSRLKVVAENRGLAPARLILDIFKAPPRDDSIITIVDDRTDPAHVARLEQQTVPTDPGKAVEIVVDNFPWDAGMNEHGPAVWFRVPIQIRNVFYLHELTWNGHNMLKEKGFAR